MPPPRPITDSHRAPPALFHGLLLAAVLLGAVEATQLAWSGGVADRADRWTAAVYVMAPYILFGLVAAAAAAGLAGLWTHARRIGGRADNGPGRAADAGAGLLALVGFAGVLYLIARFALGRTHDRTVDAAALALATPAVAVGALYFWAVARTRLAALDARWGGATSKIVTGVIALGGLLAIGLTVAGDDALRERLGGWTVGFLVAYPLLTLALTAVLRRLPPGRLSGSAVRRTVLIAGIVSAIGAADLVVHIDARAAVKRALLHQTLVFQPLVLIAQPLFDADGDGYAGLLGGGDCDDDDPAVHPGAREIARNSIDDDCFGGDSPGTAAERAAARAARARAGAPTPTPVISAPAARLAERPHIILITIDTLRADRLGYAGYRRETSPVLDGLARRGLRFTWAFGQGPQTKASMPSMFIGRYFSEIQRTPDLWAAIHPENITLAERLQAAGYHTAGIPSHRFFLPGYGLDQGFVEWDTHIIRRYQKRIPQVITGHLVSDAAVKWLAGRADDTPFFLWLHYIDPHHTYRDHPDIHFGSAPEDLYDEEIRYTDAQIGRVLDWLDDSLLADSTYVIVHSDHGEGFFTHGYRYHGQHLYNDQVRVPLIIAGPGLPSRQIEQPVGLIDVAPTVLALAGLDVPGDLRGMSLLPYGTDMAPPKHPPVFVEMVKDATHSDRRAIIDWPWKLQYGITFDEYQLFDLSTDPDELLDLAESHPDELARLRAALRRWMSEGVEPVKPRR